MIPSLGKKSSHKPPSAGGSASGLVEDLAVQPSFIKKSIWAVGAGIPVGSPLQEVGHASLELIEQGAKQPGTCI